MTGYTLAGDHGNGGEAQRDLFEDRLRSLVHRLRAARHPRLLVSVMVDEPRGDIYGGTVAAPAFERIMEFALPYLKIPPE